jgi:transposase
MALATFDFFGRIIPSWSTAFGGLNRLAVDDASRWTGFAASCLAGLQQQFLIREKRRGDPRLANAERDETVRVGHNIKRIALAFEAAFWLEACGVEAHVIHPANVAVSRQHRRAKTDRLDAELLERGFSGEARLRAVSGI